MHDLLDLDDLLDDARLSGRVERLGEPRPRGGGLRQRGGAARRRVRLGVVRAVDPQRQLALRRLRRVRRLAVARPQRRQLQRRAGRHQPAEAEVQRGHAVLLAAIERGRDVGTVAEDLGDEPGEHAVGPDLDEGACPGVGHGADLVDEPHGLGDRLAEPAADRLGVVAVRRRRRVVVRRDARRPEGDVLQERRERPDRVGHDRRVERRGDHQALGLDADPGQPPLERRDGLGRPRDDDLRRRVVVGHRAAGDRGDVGLDLLDGARHGGHRAVGARCRRHPLAALARDPQRIVGVRTPAAASAVISP
ncbi:MAG: hypothetical protein R3F59_16225 [Myxococcota bacterium]